MPSITFFFTLVWRIIHKDKTKKSRAPELLTMPPKEGQTVLYIVTAGLHHRRKHGGNHLSISRHRLPLTI